MQNGGKMTCTSLIVNYQCKIFRIVKVVTKPEFHIESESGIKVIFVDH